MIRCTSGHLKKVHNSLSLVRSESEGGVLRIMYDLDKIPEDMRVFNSRFVDKVKYAGTARAFEKSRLVIQAYNDAGKEEILTKSPTVQRISVRILLLLMAMFPHLRVLLRDVI
jgi:hypothetical protein